MAPAGPAGANPPHDDFVNAVDLGTGPSGSVPTLQDSAASAESGEPGIGGGAAGESVWSTYIPALTNSERFTCSVSQFGVKGAAAVYTGSSVSALTLVAESTNCTTGLTFSAIAGTTYRIKLEPEIWIFFATVNMSFTNVAPVNDNFGAGTAISATSGVIDQAMEGATTEAGEPSIASRGPYNTVWFTFSPTIAGRYTFDTCSTNFDTVLGVFTGFAVGALTSLGQNDDGCVPGSSVTIDAATGASYRIVIGSFNPLDFGSHVRAALHWTATVPANDNFAAAAPIAGTTGTVSNNNLFATLETGEPGTAATVTRTVWYTFVAPLSAPFEIDTCEATTFDTTLGVYTGSAVGTLTQIKFSDDSCAAGSRVKFNTVVGTTYRIQVGGYGNFTGGFTLHWRYSPVVSIGDASVSEGDAGSVNAVFAVRLDRASTNAVSVTYNTADGTAGATTDYTAQVAKVLTIPAGATGGLIKVPVVKDTAREGDETFTVALSSPINATLDRVIGTATILENDPVPAITIGDVVAPEGDSGSGTAYFDVTLDRASSSTVTVDYATASGTATATDFTAASGTWAFSPGVTTQQIAVQLKGDVTVEPNETFTVNLTNPVNATIADATGQLSIRNDDTAPIVNAVSVGNLTVSEGSSASHVVKFPVRLAHSFASAVTVNYTTSPGVATAPGDYATKTGTLTFAAGSKTAAISITIVGDTAVEPNEGLNITISSPTGGAVLGPAVGSILIRNDDVAPVPTLSIGDGRFVEGDSGSLSVAVPITLTQASANPVTVLVNSADGTTVAGSDYTAAVNKLVTIPAGSLSATVSVTIKVDLVFENDETFTLTLSGPTGGAVLGRVTGTNTILNDD